MAWKDREERHQAAFLGRVAEQLGAVAANEAGGTFQASAWSDGQQAVLELESTAGGMRILELRARFDPEGAEALGFAEKLRVTAEFSWPGDEVRKADIGSLYWKGAISNETDGLLGPADWIDDARGKGRVLEVIAQLIREAGRAAAGHTRLHRFPVAQLPSRQVATVPAVREMPPARARHTTKAEEANKNTGKLSPDPLADLAHLATILQSLPESEDMDVTQMFGGFVAAVRRVTPLREGEVAGFIGEALSELQAYQEAYISARSPLTEIGMGLKGAALIGAFLVSMGVETWTGVKAFGPIFGEWGAALPAAFGSCVIGGGLMPLAATPKEVLGVRNLAIAWSVILSMAVATGDTAKSIRHRFPEGLTLLDARAEVSRLKAEMDVIGARLAEARGAKDAAGKAYLAARKNRPGVFNDAAGELKSLETKEDSAVPGLRAAEMRAARAEEQDRSLYFAEAVVFLFAAVLNAAGPFFIGKYFSKLAGSHEAAMKRARKNRLLLVKARLFGSESGQRQKARVMLSALESYYVNELERRGLDPDEIQRRAKSAFGNAGKIVNTAVRELRRAKRPGFAGLSRLWGRDPALE